MRTGLSLGPPLRAEFKPVTQVAHSPLYRGKSVAVCMALAEENQLMSNTPSLTPLI